MALNRQGPGRRGQDARSIGRCGWTTVVTASVLLGVACSMDSEQAPNVSSIGDVANDADGTARMVDLLEALARDGETRGDMTVGMETRIAAGRKKLDDARNFRDRQLARVALATDMLNAGQSLDAIGQLDTVQVGFDELGIANPIPAFDALMATAYLRVAEQSNCHAQHNRDSCLFPIRGGGVHSFTEGSRRAVGHLKRSLENNPDNLAARWLLNIAHMALDQYPDQPSAPLLIPPEVFASGFDVGRFANVAYDAGVAVSGLAGGVAMEDFDGDGDLDLITSGWGMRDPLRFFANDGGGRFEERSAAAGLTGQVGGLNLAHADYDNDGDADVLVLRGAWQGINGRQPNSLLRNNGDGSFVDVTEFAGVFALHPTQVGTWADYDNDGWLDLFVGNESDGAYAHPCQLYRNNGDGTFSDVAALVGVDRSAFVKGATWGDFDNDGWVDLYLSVIEGPNVLFRNETGGDTGRFFREVTTAAGVAEPIMSFPTWFFDYDNDGWLDLFVGAFAGFYGDSLADVAAGYLREPFTGPHPRLYRNNGDGTFTEHSEPAGLKVPMLSMGANFGDIDNDGFADFYLGTGEPNLRTLVPNRMYRNAGDGRFQNVSTAGGFGHLQKGHGIAFGDIDNDGDQDIYAVMGGAYQGDVAINALFLNPGHDHRYVTLLFDGVKSNRAGVGTRVEIRTRTGEGTRTVTATVGTGGSFGSSSLRQEIGLGDAQAIEYISVHWPASGEIARYTDVVMDRRYRVREGSADLELIDDTRSARR